MTIHVIKTPDVYISASGYKRLQAEYQQAFMVYAGTPPDFDEWAIARIRRWRDNNKFSQLEEIMEDSGRR